MASSNTVRMSLPRPEPSSDGTYMPESTPPDDFWPDEDIIRTSEVQYLEDHNTPERLAMEQRVLKQLQKLTNQSMGKGSAASRPQRTELHKTIQLTPEQARVHHLVVNEKCSIFFTGAAGTGKSILLRRIIDDLRVKHGNWIAVTASTGIAACAVGGRTIHSWAGIGLGAGDASNLIKNIRRSTAASARWKMTRCLIVDEVSMLSPELLDKLNIVAQKLRKNRLPFGGMQVILTGDFFQLPPVDLSSKNRQYAFDAQCWNQIVTRTILLTQVFRQTDTKFQQMLTEARYGNISTETAELFSALNRDPPNMPPDIIPTRLFSRRHEVDRANNESLRKLSEDPLVFEARDHVYPPPDYGDERRAVQQKVDPSKITWIAPQTVTLKKGAQVMMIKNIDETLVNGSIGRILAWVEVPPIPPSLTDNKNVIDVTSIANEIHSCSFSKLMKFERSLCNDGKAQESKNVEKKSETLLPLVRFFNRNGTFRDVILQKETWNYENEFGDVMVSRTQLPLILAYALSIHKAQGQTLDYVHVDMRSVFEVGQAYVALSRATHLDGLKLVGFNPARVKCDPRVAQFYDGLERVVQPSVRDLFGANQRDKRLQDTDNVKEENNYETDEESEGHRDLRELFTRFAHKRHAPDHKTVAKEESLEPKVEARIDGIEMTRADSTKLSTQPPAPIETSSGDEPIEVPESVIRSATQPSVPPKKQISPQFHNPASLSGYKPIDRNTELTTTGNISDLGPVPDIYIPPPPHDTSNDLFVSADAFDCTVPLFLSDSEFESEFDGGDNLMNKPKK